MAFCAAVFHQRLHGQITRWDRERNVQQGGVASSYHLQQQYQPLGEGGQQQSERWADDAKCSYKYIHKHMHLGELYTE